MAQFKLPVEDEYPHLPQAPIVEAVIDIRAPSQVDHQEELLRRQLDSKLPDYQYLHSLNQFELNTKLEKGGTPQSAFRSMWSGLSYKSTDNHKITQFNLQGMTLSRLKPYRNWKDIFTEAMRMWAVYENIFKPASIARIGLRYINNMDIESEANLHNFIRQSPAPPADGMPLLGFMHQNSYAIAGHPYVANIITLLRPIFVPAQSRGLVLDIDVFTKDEIPVEQNILEKALQEMHDVKNRIFFNLITPDILKQFKREI